jgi:uncharacterized protein (TIGR01619 family)
MPENQKQRSRWIEYDWILNSAPAVYRVDMEFKSLASGAGCKTLALVKCGTREAGAPDMTPRERRAALALEKKCLRLPGVFYAGSIDTGSGVRMYFYGRNERELESVAAATENEDRLICSCSIIYEPELETYYRFLYPDSAKYQTVKNERLIEDIRKRGDNTQAPRRINLHMYFPTEPLRVMFQEEARQSGFAIGGAVYTPEQELPYGIVLHRISTLEKRDIDAVTTKAIRAAEKFGGELIHWDCQFICKGSPLR